ncbi:MAG: hypothetical protein ACFFF4_06410 [Candidatus Thorarchaeota archaeon]
MQLFNELKETDFNHYRIPHASEKIRVINELVINHFGPKFEVVTKERLQSKKNLVYHVILKPLEGSEINFIAKVFATGNFEIEQSLLEQCSEGKIKVPEIIEARDGVMLLSYIKGELLVDRLNKLFEVELIDELAQWYFDFHSFQPLLKGDPRLRNFIVGFDGLYGFDFEEAAEGNWIIDIGGIASSLLDTDPINDSRKQAMVSQLLDKYLELKGIERTINVEQNYLDVISNTLKQTAKRRASVVLSDLADKVKKNGLSM